ncbi:MAG: monovalent cation/H+ antiporter subunit D family protein [Deltaproteobacteria bacterium]|nr:monovalent cation/H+ antiporter subunit D family protein [Deltaproteobacteria bacterium]
MNPSGNLPILVIVIPLISALLIPIFGMFAKKAAWYVAAAITFLSLIFSISLLDTALISGRISYRLGGWEPPWGIEYAVDYLNGFVLVTVSFIFFLAAIYSKKSVEKEIAEDKATAFYAVYMLFFTGLMGMTITGDIFNLYVFIEITALAGYTLTAMGKRREALLASYNYLILGTIAATFILIGIGYLYIKTGTLNMGDLSERLPALYGSTAIRTAFAFITVGLCIKLALFPFHIWLPGVHTHAPSVISVLLSAIAVEVGAYVLFRLMFNVFTVRFYLEAVPVTKILLFLSASAIVAGSVLAIAQTKIKRMLAYSTVGQMGYIVLGAAISNPLSVTGSLLHILNHAMMKGSLFMAAGAVIYATGIEDISGLKGMGRRMPFTMAAFTISSLSMIGMPLTVGFVSKWYLALGALKSGMWYIVLLILLSSLLMAVYFWRVVETIYFPGDGGHTEVRCDAPAGMVVPTLILSLLCVVFGAAAALPVGIATKAANMLLGIK